MEIEIFFGHVKGHSFNMFNEIADFLANQGAEGGIHCKRWRGLDLVCGGRTTHHDLRKSAEWNYQTNKRISSEGAQVPRLSRGLQTRVLSHTIPRGECLKWRRSSGYQSPLLNSRDRRRVRALPPRNVEGRCHLPRKNK
jgi:hypothetical protein